MCYSLEGLWTAVLDDGNSGEIHLPGTLDENGLGHKDTGANQWHPDAGLGNGEEGFDADAPIATRFTRNFTYEGEARFIKTVDWKPPMGKRVFLEAERARCLRLLIDGEEVPHVYDPSVSTPHVFEVTGLLDGPKEITLVSDNSYPGLPHDAIVYSSAATDETQTNWNGVLGYLRLRIEEPVFLAAVRVYPWGNQVTVQAEISAAHAYQGVLRLESEALEGGRAEKKVVLQAGTTVISLENLPLKKDVRRWDEYEGFLYELTASLEGAGKKCITFGVRDFGDDGRGRLALNGRTVFIRSEANCAEFPETGYPLMEEKEWERILRLYKSYGINCMRFHSHCPPEAAFAAADKIGMMMQPELSHWNPRDAFEQEESFAYYRTELEQVILWLANHPSFVMLTFGNELHTGPVGHQRMDQMLELAHSLDGTRLYANGSNAHYGAVGCDENSDFYTAQGWFEEPLRGTFAGHLSEEETREGRTKTRIKGYINNQYPSAMVNYDKTMENLRKVYKKPVFSFEVGQFEVLPDFGELERFSGISKPANLELIRDKARKLGLLPVWNRYVEAAGEISRIGYREEIEAAMRTRQMSGISLLGLQDFPGQGTALVGMLNSHLEPKPFGFARPEAFHVFFRDQLPLVLLERYTYETGDKLHAEIQVANFGKQTLEGLPEYVLSGEGICLRGELEPVVCPAGELSAAGMLDIALDGITEPARMELTVRIGEVTNSYPVWVYPKEKPCCPDSIYETETLDKKAREVLAAGGKVYLSPPSDQEHLPDSIQAQFTSDFWSVGTFQAQEGGMGQLIDEKHPLFKEFPTEFHTNWQWWPMASARALILPEPMEAIITEMDSYAYMRPMAQLLECRCGGGKLMISSMGLQNLRQYPEARALLRAIYMYMESEEFMPKQEIAPEVIAKMIK